MEHTVKRICGPLGLSGPEGETIGGFIGIDQGRFEYTPAIIRAGIENQSRFILATLGYGTPEGHWRMNVYEFYREFVRAYKVHKQRQAEAEKQKRRR